MDFSFSLLGRLWTTTLIVTPALDHWMVDRWWPDSRAMEVSGGEQGAAAGRGWPYESGPSGGNILAPDDVDVFFHSLDSNGNPVNAATYYASPAAARAVHGYRPSPHGKFYF